MKVTPAKRKFGKYTPGQEFDLRDKTAKVLIKLGKLAAVPAAPAPAAPVYQTRMMQAAAPVAVPIQRAAEAPPATQVALAAAPAAEVDAAGVAWDERQHASTKAKNTDGTWRKRPGPKSTEE